VNKTGKYVIEPQYKYASSFSNGLAETLLAPDIPSRLSFPEGRKIQGQHPTHPGQWCVARRL
ncbi:MAG: WG repeat-containing protein, partial [Prevotella sp.]|nr:WG repeat-containing protein [Prevotella sp.]